MKSYSLIKSEKAGKTEKLEKISDARFSFSTGNNRIFMLQTFAKVRVRICKVSLMNSVYFLWECFSQGLGLNKYTSTALR